MPGKINVFPRGGIMSDNVPPEGITQTVPNSTLALVSLIAGILGLTVLPTIGSIAAVITGYMAKKEIRESGGALSGDGMATAGLILGWIGVGVLLIGMCVACVVFALIPLGFLKYGRETLLPGLLYVVF
jgi:hypothetical protein